MYFNDRIDAGKQLAQLLSKYKNDSNALVIALPRGGVVLGYEVARVLDLPLDIVVPRKIGAPSQEELAVGALTPDGEIIWNESVMQMLGLKPSDVSLIIKKEIAEAERRKKTYRGDRPPLELNGKTVIVVDDGIATGATMRAALASVKKQGASKIVVAVPLATPEIVDELNEEVDEVICLIVTDHFGGVSAAYRKFDQTSDEQVISLMKQSSKV